MGPNAETTGGGTSGSFRTNESWSSSSASSTASSPRIQSSPKTATSLPPPPTAIPTSSSSSLQSLWIFLLLAVVGGQCIEGGWDAVFDPLERVVVVPFYKLLIVLHLILLIAAWPLEAAYHKWRRRAVLKSPFRKTSRQGITTTDSSTTITTATSVDTKEAEEVDGDDWGWSGSFQLIHNDNFDGFLAVQGVPWALRRAANQVRPIHCFTYHRGGGNNNNDQWTIQIKGIIESQTTYTILGPPVETNIRGRIFRDVARYYYGSSDNDNNTKGDKDDALTTSTATLTSDNDVPKGIIVSKTAVTEAYDVTVQRVWSNPTGTDSDSDDDEDKNNNNPSEEQQQQKQQPKQIITVTSRALFHDGRPPVECVQIFQRIA